MADEEDCPACPDGIPEWIMTFADLMSLLMCFFVLLLSFSQIDAKKYKQIAGSLRMAFGVQREIEMEEPPKGTSIIAQEFSPAQPEPTPINVVTQNTQDNMKQDLEVTHAQLEAALEKEMELNAEKIREALSEEIAKGQISVETSEDRVIVRINEKGSFSSGNAALKPGFLDAMDRITAVLKHAPGQIVVAGHTDNIPINTARFRSNWELSAARAVTVAHTMIQEGGMPPERITVEGHADTQPLVPNDTWADRAKNRRVEIVLLRAHAPAPVQQPDPPKGDQP